MNIKMETFLNNFLVIDLELRLRRLNDQKDMRLREFQKFYRDTYNAVEWLRANQDMFKHKIHEPVALVVSLRASFLSILMNQEAVV